MATIRSPVTGRNIRVGGPTYNDLVERGIISPRRKASYKRSTSASPRRSPRRGTASYKSPTRSPHTPKRSPRKSTSRSPSRKSPSRSSRSPSRRARSPPKSPMKIHTETRGPFCGPAGGLPNGTYPVNTPGRARAAMARAHFAARRGGDPEAIKECARRQAERMGWFD